jgi:hypothetical protein
MHSSTVGRPAAAPTLNENILNLTEKKTKVNSECRCHIMNNRRSTEAAGKKNSWLRDNLVPSLSLIAYNNKRSC